MLFGMRKPLYVRALSDEERAVVQAGLRSSNAITLRRCQIVLASANKLHAQAIADQLHCDDETVRRAIKAFNTHGLPALSPASSRPRRTRNQFTDQTRTQLGQIVAQTPRAFGKETSVWTLELLAEVAFAQGLSERLVSDETIRSALKRLDINWKRAKHWITSPDPFYAQKNAGAND
jgi:transposase